MNTKKSLRCTIGWHRWEPTTVAGMRERICAQCGSNRFDDSVHPDRNARDDFVAILWSAFAASPPSGGGFGG